MILFAFILSGLMVPILVHWSDQYIQGGIPILRRSLRERVGMITLFTSLLAFILFLLRRLLAGLTLSTSLVNFLFLLYIAVVFRKKTALISPEQKR